MPGHRTDSSWLVCSAPAQTLCRDGTSACRPGVTSLLGSAAEVGSLAAATIIIHQLMWRPNLQETRAEGSKQNHLANSKLATTQYIDVIINILSTILQASYKK